MKLTQISVIKNLMAENETVFKKKFGQNFLINESIPKRIAQSAAEAAGNPFNVIEIGPGIGTLTSELCILADKVCAIEIDPSLIPILNETLSEYSNVTLINDDIMKCRLDKICMKNFSSEKFSVCANLPYYITTPIIMSLLEGTVKPEVITVMVQREVADRLTALPGSSQYGSISASVAWYGQPKRLFCVPSTCFMPRPNVDSAVVQITVNKRPPAYVKDEKILRRVIRGAFAQRRKTLLNSLSSEFDEYDKPYIADAISKCGLNINIRGEALGICEFAALSNLL